MKKGYKYLLPRLLALPGIQFVAGSVCGMFRVFVEGCSGVILLACFLILHLSLLNITRSNIRRLRE